MKKLLLFPILLFIFLFSGCKNVEKPDLSTSIIFSVQTNEQGGVTQSFSFPVKNGNEEMIKEINLAIKLKIFFPIFYNYYLSSANLQGEDVKYKLGGDFAKYQMPFYDENDQTISFFFTFENDYAWNKYHDTSESGGLEKESGFFVDKYFTSGDFVFSSMIISDGKSQTLGEYIVEILSTIEQKYFYQNDYSFVYEYVSPSNKLRSNADYIYENSHIWQANLNQLNENKKVEIYILSPNRAVWYGGILIITCLFVGSVLGIKFYQDKKKKLKREKKS